MAGKTRSEVAEKRDNRFMNVNTKKYVVSISFLLRKAVKLCAKFGRVRYLLLCLANHYQCRKNNLEHYDRAMPTIKYHTPHRLILTRSLVLLILYHIFIQRDSFHESPHRRECLLQIYQIFLYRKL